MKIIHLPGADAERGKPIRPYSDETSLYYVNKSKAIKQSLDLATSEIIPLQNLHLNCLITHKGCLYGGDKKGHIIQMDLKTKSLSSFSVLEGEINDLFVFQGFVVAIGGDQKIQGKVLDFEKMEEGKPGIVLNLKNLNKTLICGATIKEEMFVVGGEYGTLDFFNSKFGFVKSMPVAKSFINSIVYDEKSNSIFYGTFDRTFGHVSIEKFEQIFYDNTTFKGGIYSVAVAVPGQMIFICSSDNILRIFSLNDNKIIHACPFGDAVIAKDMALGMRICGGLVHLFSLNGNHFVFDLQQLLAGKIDKPKIIGLQRTQIVYLAMKNKQIISVSNEGKVVVDGREALNLNKGVGEAFATDTKVFLSNFGNIFVFDLKTAKADIENFSVGSCKGLFSDGKSLYIAHDNSVASYTLAPGKLSKEKETKLASECSAFGFSDEHLIFGDKKGNLTVFDLTLKEVFTAELEKGIKVTAIMNHSKEYVIAGNMTSLVGIFELSKKALKCTFRSINTAVRSLAMSKGLIYTAGFEKELLIFDVEKHWVDGTISTGNNWLSLLESAEDGTVIAADEIGGVHAVEFKK